jgi:aryl-alcohol dehydrogenase-like predicted oxidoreductase
MTWLRPDELRVGLGCMRLPPDEDLALATIAAAAEAGITVFDTARAYEGNEALLAEALRHASGARIVTKGGMARTGGDWIPDGRARSIRADCEASLAALDGLPIDLYLLHAPDPRVEWRTPVRALARLVDEGLVARVGLCNVNRTQFDEACHHAPIAAVQVALSRFDDTVVRAGLVDRCADGGIALVAHSPLGGTRRAARLGSDHALGDVARAHEATEAEVALAWVLGLGPHVVAIPGARRPETARSAAHAAALELATSEREQLGAPVRRASARLRTGDVVLVMGIQGSGKSRIAETYVERGYLRLNRDERGGTLRQLADALDEALAAGSRDIVLDNTYLSRAWRNDVVVAAARHGLGVRCIWLDTPLADAQVNLVRRLLERFDRLLSPPELKAAARKEPGVLTPTQQMRALRELEPPTDDEGFASIERIPFSRAKGDGRPGVFVAASAVTKLTAGATDADAPHLVFDWRPDGASDDLEAGATSLPAGVEWAVCTHPGGPPTCWCRPPLPVLVLEFARRHSVDPARSVVVGASPAHRTLANALGARYVNAAG